MRSAILVVVFGCSFGVWAQSSSTPSQKTPANPPSTASTPSSNPPSQDSGSAPDSSTPSSSDNPAPTPAKPARNPNLEPPRSDRVDASALEEGVSSSRDTQIDLSPPSDDMKAHPDGGSDVLPSMLKDEGSGTADTGQFRYWDPHKAAKDVEVGDFYFNRKNYKAAEDRYREALLYKQDDAMATFRLAESIDKQDRPAEAQQAYQAYLKILPNGPEAKKAEKAIQRLKGK